jgi:RHS repeat-associated protein
MGNRIRKQTNDPNAAAKIYIVDIAGQLPTILCEIDAGDCSLKNSYFYGSTAQVLCQLQHGIDPNTFETTLEDKYFYLHDRLGSVRQMIDDTAAVVNSYTYDPYGTAFTAETTGNAYNPFRFTGQWYDAEINQYYLRARQYDPQLMRFTTRDPVRGKFNDPLTFKDK